MKTLRRFKNLIPSVTLLLAALLVLPARAQITVGGSGGNTTDSSVYSGTQSLTKSGTNTVTLSGNNTYTGGTTVDGGTLVLTGSLANSASAPITVNNGGIFSIAKDNFMGGHTATVATPITINAGGQVTGGAYLNTLGTLNLNGGTLTNTGGNAYWGNLAFLLKGTVTASGDVTSTIGGSGLIMLGSDTVNSVTFAVADGAADKDLLVSSNLDNGSGASWPNRQTSFLVKTGAGKMVLAGTNIYTGTTTISGGTLQIGDGGTVGTLGLNGAVTNNATLAFNRTNAMTVANTISGTGSLVQSGTGTTTLSGVNSYSGGTVLNAGVLQVSSESQLGASNGAITLNGGQLFNNNADLSLNSARNVTLGSSGGYLQAGFNKLITIAGQISGSGGLGMVWDAGTVVLSGSNSYTGQTTIGTTGNAFYNASGINPTLRLGNANALPTASVLAFGTNVQNNTATLDLYGYAATVAGLSGSSNARITNSAAGASTLTVATPNSTETFAGLIANGSSALSLVKSGLGTQILSGNNTYTGTTTISGGTLQVGAGGTSGSLGSGAVTNNATLAINRSNTATVANAISGSGSVIKSGTGIVEFTASNTYNGGLKVSAGSAWGSTAGAFGAGAVTLGDANTGTNDVSLLISPDAIVTVANQIAVTANGTGAVTIGGRSTSGTAYNVYSGAVSLGRDVNLSASNTVSRTTFTGKISGVGGVTVTQGRVTFENTANDYTGPTVINSGAVLQLSGNELISNAGAMTVNGLLYFASGGGTETIGSLSGTGTVQAHPSVPGSYTLAVSSNASSSFGGVIANGGGAVALAKAGSGTLTLSGSNTYSGVTTISGGTLQVGAGGTSGTLGTGAVTNNATLVFNRTDALTAGNAISGTGSLVHSGNGTTTLSGSNAYSGGTTISAGTLQVGSSTAFGSGAVTNNAVVGYNSSSSFTVNNSISGTGTLSKAGTGTFTLGGNNTYTGTTTISAGTLQIGSGGTSGTLGTGALTNNGTLAINRSNAVTLGDTLSGSGSLVQAGSGTTTLAGNNTYSGSTTISAGTLQIGNGTNSTARAGTGALAVGGNTLSLNLNGNATLGHSSVTSSGLIQNLGTGRVTLANGGISGTIDGGSGGVVLSNLISNDFALKGDVTFGSNNSNRTIQAAAAGATARIVNNGSFWWIGGATAANALSLDIASGVTVSLNASHSAGSLYYNNLSGSGNFTYNSASPGYILGTSTLNGTLTVNREISVGNGGANGAAGATLIVANYNVGFNSTTNNTYSGMMSGGGALVKEASNVLTLTGNNTYSGATILIAGTLQVGDGGTAGSLGTGAVTNSAALVFNRSNAMTVANAISGTGSVTKNGGGTLLLTGSSTYTGGTTVNGGTLALGASNRLADSGGVTLNNGATFNLGVYGDYIGSLTMTGNATVAGSGQFILTNGLAGTPSFKTLTARGANNIINSNIGIASEYGGVGGNANLRFNIEGASDNLLVSGIIADKSFDG